MAVPFAKISTESPLTWNVQLAFWRDAVEHCEAMLENADVYDEDDNEAIFGVDAPKHETVDQLYPDILVRHLNLLQIVWNLVTEWHQVHGQYIPKSMAISPSQNTQSLIVKILITGCIR